jgi:hypothetical protein
MPTQMGEFIIAYVEGSRDFRGVLETWLRSGDSYDKWFLDKNAEISGIDFTSPQAQALPPPEIVSEWSDDRVTERKPGLGFCAPFAPGKTEDGRRFGNEAFVNRRDEHTESRRKLGLSKEIVFLNRTPNGDVAVVYLEGDDPAAGNRQFAQSRDAYDVWFKDECKKVFIPEIDFNDPLPAIQTVWDWEAARVRS